jgi:hypothetical protein
MSNCGSTAWSSTAVGRPTWDRFVRLINARFGPPLTDSPIGELSWLRRMGSVDDYAKRFMALSCRDATLTEPQRLQLFVASLGNPLHTDIALQQPATLDDTVIIVRAYEQRGAPREGSTLPESRTSASFAPRPLPLPAPSATPLGVAAPAVQGVDKPATIRLSLAEIAQRRKDGKCFHRDEFFNNGYKKVCRHLFIIEVMGEEDNSAAGELQEPRISLHALTGFQPRFGGTM